MPGRCISLSGLCLGSFNFSCSTCLRGALVGFTCSWWEWTAVCDVNVSCLVGETEPDVLFHVSLFFPAASAELRLSDDFLFHGA